jgi:serine/threonine protein kinase
MERLTCRENINEMRNLTAEIDTLRRLEHPNIVSYYGYEERDDKLFIFTEWCPGGSISDMLKKFGALEEHVVALYTRQILEGLKYLHGNGIIHRDIKGANLLVDASGNVKLAGSISTTRFFIFIINISM